LWWSGQKQVEDHYVSSDTPGGDVFFTRYNKIDDTFTHGIYFYHFLKRGMKDRVDKSMGTVALIVEVLVKNQIL
jgi:hypothetical protein